MLILQPHPQPQLLILTIILSVAILDLAATPAFAYSGVQDSIISRLKKSYPDFVPSAIIDAGANNGRWSTRARAIFPEASIFLLEATPKHDEALKAVTKKIGNAEHRITVLTATVGETVQFFQGGTGGSSGNSMFKENTNYYSDIKPVERKSDTIDNLIQNSVLLKDKVVDIIKADVQGAELMLLQGAVHALAQATFVQLEGSTVEYNAGGMSCAFQLDAFLRSHGFYLYDFGDLAYDEKLFKTKGVGQYDMLYIKPTSKRLPKFLVDKGTKFCGQDQGRRVPGTKQYYGAEFPDFSAATTPEGKMYFWLSGFCIGILACAVAHWLAACYGKKNKKKRSMGLS